MKAQGQQQGSTVSSLFCFSSSAARLFMLPPGARTSTPENLKNFTILGHQSLQSTLTARGNQGLAGGECTHDYHQDLTGEECTYDYHTKSNICLLTSLL